MLLIDYSLDTPEANLAFDEAMIESASSHEALRLWEMPQVCVVMGRGSKEFEVDQDACQRDAVPVLRRCSGGASVVAGPGCLMYSLLFSLDQRPLLRSIDAAHRFVMGRLSTVFASLDPRITHQGSCDLTIEHRKFSGTRSVINAIGYCITERFSIDSLYR